MGSRLGTTIAVVFALAARSGAGVRGWQWSRVPTVETVREGELLARQDGDRRHP
jgi:hypothetical protein